jgi:cell division protein FtsN
MKMKMDYLKIFVIFSLLLIAGCSSNKEEQKTEIRFVDLQGNARAIKTRVPEANAKIMSGQSSYNSDQNSSEIYNENSAISKNSIASKNIPTNKNKIINSDNFKRTSPTNLSENTTPNETNTEELNDNTPIVEYDFSKEDEKNKNTKTKNDSSNDEKEYVENDENQIEPIEKNTKSPNKKLSNKGSKIITYSNKRNAKNNKKLNQYNNVDKSSEDEQEGFAEEAPSSEINRGKSGKFYVQVGSFFNSRGAKERLKKTSEFGKGKVLIAYKDNKKVYRSVFGPFKSKKSAIALQNNITESGNEAIIIRGK